MNSVLTKKELVALDAIRIMGIQPEALSVDGEEIAMTRGWDPAVPYTRKLVLAVIMAEIAG